jgi:[ribosomal protein S18]-alanine N-acetyltransferase
MSTPLAATIAAATADDAPELTRLAQECGLSVDVAAELVRPYALLPVARQGSQVVGFLLAWRAADELHLTDLGVTASARRGGIGRGLVSWLCREGELSSARVVLLEVRESNAPAIALYRALGFEELDRRARYYSDTDEDAVVMQRVLR